MTNITTGARRVETFAGMFLHQPTSTIPPIYLTLFRAYDPYSGRWLSRDPAEETIGGLNLYAYARLLPSVDVDVKGLAAGPSCPAANDNRCQEFYEDLKGQILDTVLESANISLDIQEGDPSAAAKIRRYNSGIDLLNQNIDDYNDMCGNYTPQLENEPYYPEPGLKPVN